MHNSIILSSCLFGSFYLFSVSLGLINYLFLENKKIYSKLELLRQFTVIFFHFVPENTKYINYNKWFNICDIWFYGDL